MGARVVEQRLFFLKHMFFPLRVPQPLSRMQLFFTSMEIQVSRKVVKQEAKYAKKFLVLIKRKLNRGQVPHDLNFRRLLALLAPEKYNTQDCKKKCHQLWYFISSTTFI